MDTSTLNYLIRVLHDKSMDIGVRDDAAMDLGAYDEPRALEALVQTATDSEEHEMILDSCGTSIMEIWGRKGSHNRATFDTLTSTAKISCNVMGLLESD